MEPAEAETLRRRLEEVVRREWSALDPEARITSHLRADARIDMTVISQVFAGRDSQEREACFWPVFADVPTSDLIQMTYCLLLTPEEAAQHFSQTETSDVTGASEDWD